MEPADLNSSAADARLEAMLRQPAQPLPDDGFSERVLAALPPARETVRPTALRRVILAVGATAGILLAVLGPMLRPATTTTLADALAELSRASQSLSDPTLALALVVTALCLLYVFRPRWLTISFLS